MLVRLLVAPKFVRGLRSLRTASAVYDFPLSLQPIQHGWGFSLVSTERVANLSEGHRTLVVFVSPPEVIRSPVGSHMYSPTRCSVSGDSLSLLASLGLR